MYWLGAFSSTTYMINRLSTKVLDDQLPFEVLYFQVLVYSNFRTYGCQVFSYVQDYVLHKLSPRSLICVFISYNDKYKGYCFLDPTTYRVYITRHARFIEPCFDFLVTIYTLLISSLDQLS